MCCIESVTISVRPPGPLSGTGTMHHGQIGEKITGEGKTPMTAVPAYLSVLRCSLPERNEQFTLTRNRTRGSDLF